MLNQGLVQQQIVYPPYHERWLIPQLLQVYARSHHTYLCMTVYVRQQSILDFIMCGPSTAETDCGGISVALQATLPYVIRHCPLCLPPANLYVSPFADPIPPGLGNHWTLHALWLGNIQVTSELVVATVHDASQTDFRKSTVACVGVGRTRASRRCREKCKTAPKLKYL